MAPALCDIFLCTSVIYFVAPTNTLYCALHPTSHSTYSSLFFLNASVRLLNHRQHHPLVPRLLVGFSCLGISSQRRIARVAGSASDGTSCPTNSSSALWAWEAGDLGSQVREPTSSLSFTRPIEVGNSGQRPWRQLARKAG
ncbi:hypothetical protein B0I37DRAFT_198332 [Chaetomium sp. MPI-CAGE-AT-0009]|nr:hypothetical protein B0I37DRAFT_198332 [Chaetomium sp. MPI-CAGE-AT-0009]